MTAASFVVVAQVLVDASAGARQRTATVKTTAAVQKQLWEDTRLCACQLPGSMVIMGAAMR